MYPGIRYQGEWGSTQPMWTLSRFDPLVRCKHVFRVRCAARAVRRPASICRKFVSVNKRFPANPTFDFVYTFSDDAKFVLERSHHPDGPIWQTFSDTSERQTLLERWQNMTVPTEILFSRSISVFLTPATPRLTYLLMGQLCLQQLFAFALLYVWTHNTTQ